MQVITSGGFGDFCNCVIKAYKLGYVTDIVYIRDSVDERILTESGNLTRDYSGWAKAIAERNGFSFGTVTGNQKTLCDEFAKDPNNVILGPNLSYGLKIWEESRGLYVGYRPNETEVTINEEDLPVKWQYDKQDVDVVVQVRFGDEYPTKHPNASVTMEELVGIVWMLNEQGRKVTLIGQTRKNISPLRTISNILVDRPVLDQYNAILSANAVFGYAGFCSSLCFSAKKPMARMFWDEAETKLQVPDYATWLTPIRRDKGNITGQIREWKYGVSQLIPRDEFDH